MSIHTNHCLVGGVPIRIVYDSLVVERDDIQDSDFGTLFLYLSVLLSRLCHFIFNIAHWITHWHEERDVPRSSTVGGHAL